LYVMYYTVTKAQHSCETDRQPRLRVCSQSAVSNVAVSLAAGIVPLSVASRSDHKASECS
jgi:hypothetical protein